MSLPEVLLWREIKKAGNPLRIRRQHPIANNVVDFASTRARAVIEIDGDSHEIRAERDALRDASLAALGWRTFRFSAASILADPAESCAWIHALLREVLAELGEG